MIEQSKNSAKIITSESNLPFQVRDLKLGDIGVRLLGPISFWGGEVTISNQDVVRFKQVLREAAKQTGFRYSGYFIEQEETSTFHLSRLPRRVGLAVPSVEEFQSSLRALSTFLENAELEGKISEESRHAQPRMRAILGLQEGYYEPRKKDLVAKIGDGTITSLSEARSAGDKLGLDLARFGIEIGSFLDLGELAETLKSTSFTIEHSPANARRILSQEFSINIVEIYAVSPESTYSEPAIRVETATSPHSLEHLVSLGNDFRQARFSLEYLDKGEAHNVELLNFSTDRAASTT